MNPPTKKSFILASRSPRRKQLLTEHGYNFTIIPSSIDESKFPEDITPIEHAKILALEKAKDIAKNHPASLVMGADTIADFNGQIIGKPENKKHAEQILKKLFSQPHKIITAIALVKIDSNLQLVETETTTVFPKPMTPAQLKQYLDSEKWKGKAGAYGIQDTNDKFIEKIEGSYTNVMGLPIELTKKLLDKYL